MSLVDKGRAKAEEVAGKVKEKIGEANDDRWTASRTTIQIRSPRRNTTGP